LIAKKIHNREKCIQRRSVLRVGPEGTMAELLSFDDVIQKSKSLKLHLVLGNGFSIAKFPKIFTYDALFSRADFTKNDRLKRVFDNLKSHDFEAVMRHLLMFVQTGAEYGVQAAAIDEVKKDIESLKQVLIQTICNNHPDSPNDVDDASYKKCFEFLKRFLGRRQSHIYTLNYDLLLYWCIARVGLSDGTFSKIINDGFSNSSTGSDAEYVSWQGEGQAFFSNIRYPHGALHIFDAGDDIQKITFSRTNERLIDQTRKALDQGLFPLFVSEGSSQQKIEKIKHNSYLYTCYQQFCGDVRGLVKDGDGEPDTAMVIYGHSLNSVDDHFWKKLMRGKIRDVYVSVYGGLDSVSGLAIQQNVRRLKKAVPGSVVAFNFFNAESVDLW
jgi:hypothetical protein